MMNTMKRKVYKINWKRKVKIEMRKRKCTKLKNQT